MQRDFGVIGDYLGENFASFQLINNKQQDKQEDLYNLYCNTWFWKMYWALLCFFYFDGEGPLFIRTVVPSSLIGGVWVVQIHLQHVWAVNAKR